MKQLEEAMEVVRFGASHPSVSLWEQFFGPYPWFYAPFVGHYAGIYGVRISDAYRKFRPMLPEVVPAALSAHSSWGQWLSLSRVQFDSVLSQRLVRLDKAILTILMIEQAIKLDQDEDVDALRVVLPSTWVVEGLQGIKDRARLDEIAYNVKQGIHVIDELARGQSVVEHIAKGVVQTSEYLRIGRLSARLLTDRRNLGWRVGPVAAQNLDIEDITLYYGLRPKTLSKRPIGPG